MLVLGSMIFTDVLNKYVITERSTRVGTSLWSVGSDDEWPLSRVCHEAIAEAANVGFPPDGPRPSQVRQELSVCGERQESPQTYPLSKKPGWGVLRPNRIAPSPCRALI